MQVKDVMTPNVELIDPSTTCQEAAKIMRDKDLGCLGVSENDKLAGIVTDRDIVLTCVSDGKDITSEPIKSAMTDKVLYCFDTGDVEDVAKNMAENQLHRLPVLNQDKRLVGIVSLGDLSKHAAPEQIGQTVQHISKAA